MITREEADKYVKRYSNVHILNSGHLVTDSANAFLLAVMGQDGNLIAAEWSFANDNSDLIAMIAEHGVQRYQYAHLVPYEIATIHCYAVVCNDESELVPDVNPVNAYLVRDLEDAFRIADSFGVPLMDDGTELTRDLL